MPKEKRKNKSVQLQWGKNVTAHVVVQFTEADWKKVVKEGPIKKVAGKWDVGDFYVTFYKHCLTKAGLEDMRRFLARKVNPGGFLPSKVLNARIKKHVIKKVGAEVFSWANLQFGPREYYSPTAPKPKDDEVYIEAEKAYSRGYDSAA